MFQVDSEFEFWGSQASLVTSDIAGNPIDMRLDGNAIASIRLPILAAPRATYIGWNPVAGASGPQDLCTQMGSVLPLLVNTTAGDPRPALDALYPIPAAYVAAVRSAAAELVASRLMLPQDAEAEARMAQDGTLAKLGRLAE